MINRVILVGRMTRDPELRRTAQGDAVTSFTLAVNRNFTGRDGQSQTDFISCVVWRKPAENVERYCSKGSLVGVEGRLQTRNYDNAQGQRVYVTEVICDSVQFLETRRNQNTAGQGETYNQSGYSNNTPRDGLQATANIYGQGGNAQSSIQPGYQSGAVGSTAQSIPGTTTTAQPATMPWDDPGQTQTTSENQFDENQFMDPFADGNLPF